MKKALILPILLFAVQSFAQKSDYNLAIGTYTGSGKGEGIYVYHFNTATANFKLKSITKGIDNPSYLTVSKNNQFLYTVNESGNASAVSAFGYNAAKGKLSFLNKQPTQGNDPCFLTTDGKNVISANYSGGSIAVFGIEADGSLGLLKQLVQHTGKGIDPQKRQESAHAHMVQFTPDKKYLVCTDLGEDQIYIYNYNVEGNAQTLTLKNVVKTTPGTGPRHITFSPNGKFAYLVHEFNGNITTFAYAKGTLNKIQEINTSDKTFTGKIDGADIHLSADGKFLYESNRGDANEISTFSISSNGLLTAVSRISTAGKGPRNFVIAPGGKYLLVAHQYTNDVVIFARNLTTGALKDTGKRITLGAPVCLVFTAAK